MLLSHLAHLTTVSQLPSPASDKRSQIVAFPQQFFLNDARAASKAKPDPAAAASSVLQAVRRSFSGTAAPVHITLAI